ncbi:hypothetical protein D4R78_08390 [bacterium]|nr:MAG: hypothetical protein D4R78_08390 [bacterium]
MKYFKHKQTRKKQLLLLLLISILGAFGGIIHGIYFDLDLLQIYRLSFFGVILTTFVLFPALLLFEYIFDLDNKADIRLIKKRIDNLEIRLNQKQGGKDENKT